MVNGWGDPPPGLEQLAEREVLDPSFDPDLDVEHATVFDWADPPSLWWDTGGKVTLDRPDRAFIKDVTDMLETDGRASAMEAALSQPIRQAEFGFEKASGDKGEAEFIEEALTNPPEAGGMQTRFSDIIGQMAWSFTVRRTFHEKVFTRRPDGKIVYKKIAWRPPASCEIWRNANNGDILGFRQYQRMNWTNSREDPYETVKMPYAFIYTNGKHRDPVNGISDLDVALWAHRMKKKCLDLWKAFLDGQATARTVVYGANDTEKKDRAAAMARIRSGGVVGFLRKNPEEKVFETIPTSTGGSSAFTDMMRWLDNVQSESIMAGHLALTGGASEGAGSLALSQDASSLYMAGRGGAAKEFEDAITTDLIAPIVALNFGTNAKVPRFQFEPIDTSKLAHIFAMFNTLSVSGSMNVPDEFLFMLTELVAQYLDLPEDRVKKMIEDEKNKPEPVPPVAGRPDLMGIEKTVDAVGRVAANNKPQPGAPKPKPTNLARTPANDDRWRTEPGQLKKIDKNTPLGPPR